MRTPHKMKMEKDIKTPWKVVVGFPGKGNPTSYMTHASEAHT